MESSNQDFQQKLQAILEVKDNPTLLNQRINEIVHNVHQPPEQPNSRPSLPVSNSLESPDIANGSPTSDQHQSRSNSMASSTSTRYPNHVNQVNNGYPQRRSQPSSPYSYPPGQLPPNCAHSVGTQPLAAPLPPPPPPPPPQTSAASHQTLMPPQHHQPGQQFQQQHQAPPVPRQLPPLLQQQIPHQQMNQLGHSQLPTPAAVQQHASFSRHTGLLPYYPISSFNSKPSTPLSATNFLNSRTPPPQLPLPSTGSALPALLPQPKQDLDFTPKFYRGPSGKSNMAFGATTVFEADESMVMNANQIQEKLSTPAIRLAKLQAIPGVDKNTYPKPTSNTVEGTASNSNNQNSVLVASGVKGGIEAIELITSPNARHYFDLALKYYDRPILSYLVNISRTRELYDQICMNRNDFSKVSDLLNKFPTNHFISVELIGAILAVGACFTNNLDEAKKFLSFLEHIMFIDNAGNLSLNESSYPKVQGMLLCALVELLLGELTKAWQLSGFALRMGLDLGFDNFIRDGPDKDVNDLKSLVFWGSYIIDKYAGLIFGRTPMLYLPPGSPIMFGNTDNKKLPHLVELIIFSQPVIASIYQSLPYKDAEDSKRNFLNRYNQLQGYNQQLNDWRRNLPTGLYWDSESLAKSAYDASVDHLLKFAYYLVFLIVNKPFLKLPIGSDIQTFGEITDEIELLLKSIPDSNYLFNIVVYYVVILEIESLIAQISNTNESTFNQNLKFLRQLGSLVDGMTRTLDPEIWIISRTIHNKFKDRYNELRMLMGKMEYELYQKRQQHHHDQQQQQQQQQSQIQNQGQQQQELPPPQQPKQELSTGEEYMKQQEEAPHPKEEILSNDQYAKQEDLQRSLPQQSSSCFAVENQEYLNNSTSMLQNDQFIKMVDTLFEPGMSGTQSLQEQTHNQIPQQQQQQQQQQQSQEFSNQDYQQNVQPEHQDSHVAPQLQQPIGIRQSQLLDPSLFNSMLMHENSSTFNSIFSFDTTGFGL